MVLRHSNSAIMLYEQTDDSSIKSTVTVESQKPTTQPSSVSCAKRVRFSTAPARCYENTTICQEEVRQECWLRPRDYKRFRAAALEASQQIIAVEQRNRAPFSYQRVLERTLEACLEVPEETDRPVLAAAEMVHLQRWLEVASSRIGLEKWSIRKIAADKVARRQALNRFIREEQTYADYSDDEQEAAEEADYLAATCERISRPSRLLARTMAQATAAAVQKDGFFEETASI